MKSFSLQRIGSALSMCWYSKLGCSKNLLDNSKVFNLDAGNRILE